MFIITWITTIKKKNKEKTEELTNQTLEQIQNTAIALIEDAEEFENYTGEEKLNWVVTRLKNLNQSIYNDDELVELVNKLVDVTRNVNVSSSKKKENGNGV